MSLALERDAEPVAEAQMNSYRDPLLRLSEYVLGMERIAPDLLEEQVMREARQYNPAAVEEELLRKYVRISVRMTVKRFYEKKSLRKDLESAIQYGLALHLEMAAKRAGPSWKIIKNFAH